MESKKRKQPQTGVAPRAPSNKRVTRPAILVVKRTVPVVSDAREAAAVAAVGAKFGLTARQIAQINSRMLPLECHNVVVRVQLCFKPDVSMAVWELWGRKDDEGFTATGTLQSKDPRCTILFFYSGAGVFVGCKSIEECRLAVRLFATRVRESLHLSSDVIGFEACNRQYTAYMGYVIDLARLAKDNKNVVYDPVNFVAAIARISKKSLGLQAADLEATEKNNRKALRVAGDAKETAATATKKKDRKCVSILIYGSGSVVLCGSASLIIAQAAFDRISPLLAHYFVRYITRDELQKERKNAETERKQMDTYVHTERMLRLSQQSHEQLAPLVLTDEKNESSMESAVDTLTHVYQLAIERTCRPGCVHRTHLYLRSVVDYPEQNPQILMLPKALILKLAEKNRSSMDPETARHFSQS